MIFEREMSQSRIIKKFFDKKVNVAELNKYWHMRGFFKPNPDYVPNTWTSKWLPTDKMVEGDDYEIEGKKLYLTPYFVIKNVDKDIL